MLKGPFLSKNWLGSCENYEQSSWVLMGIPYDGTCSFRPGSRFAPEQIRLASIGLEEYSDLAKKELSDIKFYDAGELDLPFGNREKTLEIINENVASILNDNKKVFSIGGEHLVSLPIVQAYHQKFKDLKIIHFDAHTDLRDDYLGEKLSHASVIKRITDFISPESLVQIGIRSGEKNEFEFMDKYKTLVKSLDEFKSKLKTFGGAPVYLTLDVDVLDPSIMSGTGTLEAGGFNYNELMEYVLQIKGYNVVGMDVVELAPNFDNSGCSTTTTAKIVRELLLLLGEQS